MKSPATARRHALRTAVVRSFLSRSTELFVMPGISSLLPALVLLSAAPAYPESTAPAETTTAAPTTNATSAVGLRVGITQYEGANISDAMTQRVRTMGEDVYRANGVAVGDHSSAVIVEITVGPHGEEGYASNIVARKHGQEVPGARRDNIVCELCTESELMAQLRSELEGVMPAVEGATQPDDAEPGEQLIEGPQIDDTNPPATAPISTGPSNLAKAGIATFVIGAVGVGIGAGIFVNGTQSGRDSTTAGAVVTGVGAALSVTGAVLLIVDQSRANKRRRTALAPVFDGRMAGVTVAGRF